MHETEAEQVEAIKKWWKTNGTSVLLGALIGFGMLGGWRGWQAYQQGQAEQASDQYEAVLALAKQEKWEDLGKVAQQLLSGHPGSPYAVLTALVKAEHALESGSADVARTELRWALDNATLPELQQITRLRMARLELSEGKSDAAAALLDGAEAGAFKAAYAALRGDIALADGERDKARAAYDEALDEVGLSQAQRSWLEIKRDDLGASDGKAIISGMKLALAEATPEAEAPAEATEEAAAAMPTTPNPGAPATTAEVAPPSAPPAVITPPAPAPATPPQSTP